MGVTNYSGITRGLFLTKKKFVLGLNNVTTASLCILIIPLLLLAIYRYRMGVFEGTQLVLIPSDCKSAFPKHFENL